MNEKSDDRKENDEPVDPERREFRPDDDRLSGGSDDSVQKEALGKEGSADIGNTSTTSGGAAGKIEELDTDRQRR
jgi:hypothetical protein